MKKHFLIIDDDEDELMFFVEALNYMGVSCKCTWAKSGEQGLKQLAYLSPDVIFLDYNMPRMNGLECLKAIKTMPECADIPVILHSSKMEKQMRAEGLDLGAAACIRKPDNLPRLVHFLEAFLHKTAS